MPLCIVIHPPTTDKIFQINYSTYITSHISIPVCWQNFICMWRVALFRGDHVETPMWNQKKMSISIRNKLNKYQLSTTFYESAFSILFSVRFCSILWNILCAMYPLLHMVFYFPIFVRRYFVSSKCEKQIKRKKNQPKQFLCTDIIESTTFHT